MIPKTMSSNPYDKEMQFKLDFWGLHLWNEVVDKTNGGVTLQGAAPKEPTDVLKPKRGRKKKVGRDFQYVFYLKVLICRKPFVWRCFCFLQIDLDQEPEKDDAPVSPVSPSGRICPLWYCTYKTVNDFVPWRRWMISCLFYCVRVTVRQHLV